MDDIDRELLRFLTRDARLSAAELSRELGVSRSTVQNRIDKLSASGAIAKFTIELGKDAKDALVDAIVMIKLASGDSRQTVAQLRKVAEVETLTSINGTYDFVLELRASSLRRLDEILNDIRRLPTVVETNSSIRLNRFK